MGIMKYASRGGLVLAGNQFVVAISRLVRNIIIARILSPEQFGLGVIFAITISFLEMISDAGFHSMLIQAEDGEDPRMQGTAQSMVLGRGILIGLTIALSAPLISRIFSTPELTPAFYILAFVPVIKGFSHLDVIRLQRRFQFGPWSKVQMGSSIFTTLAAIPLVLWRQDYTVFLWIAWIQMSLDTLLSHLLSKRKYQLVFDWQIVRRFYDFGWPLLINNLLLFCILHGDKLLIGSLMADKGNLAFYSIAISLATIPGMLIMKINSSLLLPLLSRVQNEKENYLRRYHFAAQLLSLISGSFAIFFIMAGGWFLVLLYGGKYSSAAVLVGWLGALNAVRMMRELPIKASTARGDTRNTMVTNAFRASTLIAAFFIIANGGQIIWVAITGLLGELVALLVSTVLLRAYHQVSLGLMWKPMAWMALGCGFAVCLSRTQILVEHWGLMLISILGGILGYAGVSCFIFKEINHRLAAWFSSGKLSSTQFNWRIRANKGMD